jgi:hypothetical protein
VSRFFFRFSLFFSFFFFFLISSFSKLFPLSRAASVATLPSALFVERLSLGARWVFLISVGAAIWESTSVPPFEANGARS